MADPQLVNYLRKELKDGYSAGQLTAYLIKKGYSPIVIEEAMKEAQQPAPATPTQPTPTAQPEQPTPAATVQPTPVTQTTTTETSPTLLENIYSFAQKHIISIAILGGTLLVILIAYIILISSANKDLCGNGKLDIGEDYTTCCEDAGCPGDGTCSSGACASPTCIACQYVEDFTCKDYECCDDDACWQDQKCEDHLCEDICKECGYVENRTCMPLPCCQNMDCDDGQTQTKDVCLQPGTINASCLSTTEPCVNVTTCDDDNPATQETCSGGLCTYTPIVTCTNDDGYCAENCTFTQDNDCELTDCTFDAECDDGDVSTYDVCEGTPLRCSHITIETCINADNYCPERCTPEEDSDCTNPTTENQTISEQGTNTSQNNTVG